MMQSESGRIRELERRLADLEKATKAGNTGLRDGRIEIRDDRDRPVLRLGKQDSGLYALALLDATGREVAWFGQLDSSALGPYPHEDKYGTRVSVVEATGEGVTVPVFEASSVDGLKTPVIAQAPGGGAVERRIPQSWGEALFATWSGAALTTSGFLMVMCTSVATWRVISRPTAGDAMPYEVIRPNVPAQSYEWFSVPAPGGIGRLHEVIVYVTTTTEDATCYLSDPLRWE